MPTGELADVPFDRAAAQDVLARVRSATAVLDAAMDRRQHLLAAARRDWQGAARRAFDDQDARLVDAAAAVRDALDRLTVRVHLEEALVEAENARRARLRQQAADAARRALVPDPSAMPVPNAIPRLVAPDRPRPAAGRPVAGGFLR